jgi:hypothetical protein
VCSEKMKASNLSHHLFMWESLRRTNEKTSKITHCWTIRCKNTDYQVAAHFEANHPLPSNTQALSMFIYLGKEVKLEILLQQREAYRISCLKTLTPSGLKIDLDLRPFLWTISLIN